MERLKGKLAVVAGAGSYLGMAIVEKLTHAGVRVLGLDSEVETLDDLAFNLKHSEGVFQYFIVDLNDEVQIVDAINWASSSIGPLHVLINNLRLQTPTHLMQRETEDCRKILKKDIICFDIITKEVVRNMLANCIEGQVIHINAILENGASKSVFKCVKETVDILTETLREELRAVGSKIKITTLCPGIAKTLLESQHNSELFPSLKCKDVIDAIGYILSTPSHVQIHDLTLSAV